MPGVGKGFNSHSSVAGPERERARGSPPICSVKIGHKNDLTQLHIFHGMQIFETAPISGSGIGRTMSLAGNRPWGTLPHDRGTSGRVFQKEI